MHIVVTTIFPPTLGTKSLSQGLAESDGTLWIIGDVPGPTTYDLPNARLVTLAEQRDLPFHLARPLPERHYARKNLGYLLAIQAGAPYIVETDDDNIPTEGFWAGRTDQLEVLEPAGNGWRNIYRDFQREGFSWPRGYPLEELQSEHSPLPGEAVTRECPIIQGLADENPDVDAIYRLTRELPYSFAKDQAPVALPEGCWCPFNSQNTTHFPVAYPLLYLPAYCSFRMTDIWRSFVAQRCLWALGGQLTFTAPTVYQERNEHNLLRDFEQEVPGYLNNDRIRRILDALTLKPGRDTATVCENLQACYSALVSAGLFPDKEQALVNAWCEDMLGLAP